MYFWKSVLLAVLFLVYKISCYNILGVFPHPGRSHFDVFQPLMLQLSKIGHNVTVISYFPLEDPPEFYHDISLRMNKEPVLVNCIDMNMVINQTRMFKYLGAMPLAEFAEKTCQTLSLPQIQNFLQNHIKFDVVLVEMFNTDCYLGLVHVMNAPFIGMSSSVILPWMNERFGNIDNPSYIPVVLMDFSDKMNFIQRLDNTFGYLINQISHPYLFEIPAQRAINKYISRDVPLVNDIARNASLFLVNTHFSLNRPRPLVPAVIEIGGIHLKKPTILPKNLEEYIKNSAHGVVYFSMGSMIKAHTFPDEKRKAFLTAFSKLKQRVLWKWDNETLPGKPDNVMIQQWMPQFDILCQPNVVAFISHGGLLGTTEAVNCGVPMIVMPQYGDQFTNAKAIEAIGSGVILHFADVTEESVSKALQTVLEPSFKKNAEKVSATFRDRPMSPLDTAVYWVEYVARHNGAPHIRTAAVDMPLYQYFLVDVIAFLLLIITLFIVSTYWVFKQLISFVFPDKKLKVN